MNSMTPEAQQRYLYLQSRVQEAHELRSKGRESKDSEMIRDAESKLDFTYGCLYELKKWFGDFPTPL